MICTNNTNAECCGCNDCVKPDITEQLKELKIDVRLSIENLLADMGDGLTVDDLEDVFNDVITDYEDLY